MPSCILRIVSGLVLLAETYCSLSKTCLLKQDWGMPRDETERWVKYRVEVVERGLLGGSVDVESSSDTLD